MKRMLGGVALAAILTAGIISSSQAQTKSVLLSVGLPDSPTAGSRLFAQKSCARCHSLGAGGDTRVGPDLGRLLFSGTVLDLAGAFWNHAPVMREKMMDLRIPPPTMTSGEMADVIALLTAYRYYVTELGGPGSPTTGRSVFIDKGCANCHSVAANEWQQPGPNLQRYRGRFSAIFLAQAMWNHGPEMASAMRGAGLAWPRFTGREMGDLVAFLQAGNGGSSEDRVYFEPGSPRRGQQLFTEKRCLGCHAIAGRGGKGGPDLGIRPHEFVGSVAAIAGLMWNHSQGMTAEFRRRGIPRALFSGQEMADIIAYLYFVNYANVRGTPSHGGEIFVAKCSACHSIGGGRRVGPDLGGVPRLDDPIAIIAAMWNHSAKMEQESRKRGLPWPRLEKGEAADLTAFLISRRDGTGDQGAARRP